MFNGINWGLTLSLLRYVSVEENAASSGLNDMQMSVKSPRRGWWLESDKAERKLPSILWFKSLLPCGNQI